MKDNMKNKNIKNIKNINKKSKSYFSFIFVFSSLFLFLIFVISLNFFKNSLFTAKDELSLEAIKKENIEKMTRGEDIFVEFKDASNKKQEKPIDNNLDPFLGDKSSKKIKLFYFSDFDCLFCSEQEQIIKNIYAKYSDKVLVIWKDYPMIDDYSGFSYQAARAARCAQKQNNFWEYSELIHKEGANFASLKNSLFYSLAGKLELDLNSFLNCMNNNSVDALILDNIKEAEDLGIMAVPYIYVNDKDFIGSMSEEELEQIIKTEIDNMD